MVLRSNEDIFLQFGSKRDVCSNQPKHISNAALSVPKMSYFCLWLEHRTLQGIQYLQVEIRGSGVAVDDVILTPLPCTTYGMFL